MTTRKMKRDAKSRSTRKKPNMVDLTGHWFVNFGGEFQTMNMEGSRVLTINGKFDADNLMEVLTKQIQDSLPDSLRERLEKNNDRITIRAFNRIDPPIALGKVK